MKARGRSLRDFLSGDEGSEREDAMPSMRQENIDNVDGLEQRFIPLLDTG